MARGEAARHTACGDKYRVKARAFSQLFLRHELLVPVSPHRCTEGHLHARQLFFRFRIARLGEVVDNTRHAASVEVGTLRVHKL